MNEKHDCTISGIKCEVKNCVHHTSDNCCDAGCIKVGPYSAEKSEETACDTFEQKFN